MAPQGEGVVSELESIFSLVRYCRQKAFQMKKAGPKARRSLVCTMAYSGRSSLKVRWPEIIVETML